jgi:hypothetical protein
MCSTIIVKTNQYSAAAAAAAAPGGPGDPAGGGGGGPLGAVAREHHVKASTRELSRFVSSC